MILGEVKYRHFHWECEHKYQMKHFNITYFFLSFFGSTMAYVLFKWQSKLYRNCQHSDNLGQYPSINSHTYQRISVVSKFNLTFGTASQSLYLFNQTYVTFCFLTILHVYQDCANVNIIWRICVHEWRDILNTCLFLC